MAATIEVLGSTTFAIDAGSEIESLALPQARRNDIILAVLACDFNLPAQFGPGTGGSQGGGIASLNWQVVDADNAFDFPGTQVGYLAVPSDNDGIIQVRQRLNRKTCVAMVTLRGPDPDSPIRATAVDDLLIGAGDPDPPSASVIENDLVVAIGLVDESDLASAANAPTGYTNLVAVDTGQGSTTDGATIMIATKAIGADGTEDPGVFSCGSTEFWRGVTIVFQPGDGDITGTEKITQPIDAVPVRGRPYEQRRGPELVTREEIDREIARWKRRFNKGATE